MFAQTSPMPIAKFMKRARWCDILTYHEPHSAVGGWHMSMDSCFYSQNRGSAEVHEGYWIRKGPQQSQWSAQTFGPSNYEQPSQTTFVLISRETFSHLAIASPHPSPKPPDSSVWRQRAVPPPVNRLVIPCVISWITMSFSIVPSRLGYLND